MKTEIDTVEGRPLHPAYKELAKAARAGKQLQVLQNNGEWKDIRITSFIFPPSVYRVKPEETPVIKPKTRLGENGLKKARTTPGYEQLVEAANKGLQLQFLDEYFGEWNDRNWLNLSHAPQYYRVKPGETLPEATPASTEAAVETAPEFTPFAKTRITANLNPVMAYEFSDIIKAAYEGYQIQHFTGSQWIDTPAVSLNAPRRTYRVKPVPEVIEIRKEKVWVKPSESALFGVIGSSVYSPGYKCFTVELKFTEVVD